MTLNINAIQVERLEELRTAKTVGYDYWQYAPLVPNEYMFPDDIDVLTMAAEPDMSHELLIPAQRRPEIKLAYDRLRANNIRRPGGLLDILTKDNVRAEEVYFQLNAAIVGPAYAPMGHIYEAGAIGDYIPFTDPDNSNFDFGVSLGGYRTTNVVCGSIVGGVSKVRFMHPEMNAVTLAAAKSVFAKVDEVIANWQQLNWDSSTLDIFASNVEFILNFLHPVTNGSGRTTEEFLRYIYQKLGRKDLPNISKSGWRNNLEVSLRSETERCSRYEYNQNLAALLGVQVPARCTTSDIKDSVCQNYELPAHQAIDTLQSAYSMDIMRMIADFTARPDMPLLDNILVAARDLALARKNDYALIELDNINLDLLVSRPAEYRRDILGVLEATRLLDELATYSPDGPIANRYLLRELCRPLFELDGQTIALADKQKRDLLLNMIIAAKSFARSSGLNFSIVSRKARELGLSI